MTTAVLLDLRTFLEREGVPYREIRHEPTRTSEESARARGVDIRMGAKAILLKADDQFCLFVLSAALKLDSPAIKKHLGIKKLRFAMPDELFSMTTLVPGCVPPFGAPILPFPLYVDPSVTENSSIAFNAGSLTTSIIMATEDYMRVAKLTMFRFAAATELAAA